MPNMGGELQVAVSPRPDGVPMAQCHAPAEGPTIGQAANISMKMDAQGPQAGAPNLDQSQRAFADDRPGQTADWGDQRGPEAKVDWGDDPGRSPSLSGPDRGLGKELSPGTDGKSLSPSKSTEWGQSQQAPQSAFDKAIDWAKDNPMKVALGAAAAFAAYQMLTGGGSSMLTSGLKIGGVTALLGGAAMGYKYLQSAGVASEGKEKSSVLAKGVAAVASPGLGLVGAVMRSNREGEGANKG